MEDVNELSASFHRYTLQPDADFSNISDPVVLDQFNAVMTHEVKSNYQAFKEAQNAENNPELWIIINPTIHRRQE